MRVLRFIISLIIGLIALILLLAEINVGWVAFFTIKFACIGIFYLSCVSLKRCNIIDIED